MRSLLTDEFDKISSKRFIAFILTLCLVAIVVSDLIFSRTITQFIFDGFVDALIWSLAFIGGEKAMSAIPEMMNRRSGRMAGGLGRRQRNYLPQEHYEEPYDIPPPEGQETEDDMR